MTQQMAEDLYAIGVKASFDYPVDSEEWLRIMELLAFARRTFPNANFNTSVFR